jgi:hypothetical protein
LEILCIPIQFLLKQRSILNDAKEEKIPEWVWNFPWHIGPFIPLSDTMGIVETREFGMRRIRGNGAFAF